MNLTFPKRTDQNIDSITFNNDKIQEHLKRLKESKSSGPDQLHPKYPKKNTARNLAEPINLIFTKSLETIEIPTRWRKANVSSTTKRAPTLQYQITVQ